MTIKVTVENPIDARIRLKARKTLDGNILILDHPEILATSKSQYGDHIYATQSRLFDYLGKKGVVDPGTIRGGNIFGSLEGTILESIDPDAADSIQMTLYSVAAFLIEEKPHYAAARDYEKSFEEELLDPNDADSTELGEVPHKPRKGTMTQYAGINTAYGLYGMYQE